MTHYVSPTHRFRAFGQTIIEECWGFPVRAVDDLEEPKAEWVNVTTRQSVMDFREIIEKERNK